MTVPVEIVSGLVAGGTLEIPMFVVPGIVDGAAYASGDAMGTLFELDLQGVRTGIIHTVTVSDRDKEQLEFDIVLFKSIFKPTADNAAFAPDDYKLNEIAAILTVTASDYKAFSANAAACVKNIGCSFAAPKSKLWGQCVTRGAPNYTAADDLWIGLSILAD